MILAIKPQEIVTLEAPFLCDIKLNGELIGQGSGPNKKIAKEAASFQAIRKLVTHETEARENRYRIKIDQLREKWEKR